MLEQSQQRLKSLSITGLRRLKNLNISFEDKEVTGIFGVNGCGKTTLLYTILCLYNQKIQLLSLILVIFSKSVLLMNLKIQKLQLMLVIE